MTVSKPIHLVDIFLKISKRVGNRGIGYFRENKTLKIYF